MLQLTLFSEEKEKSLRQQIFDASDLGKLYNSLPIKGMSKRFPKKRNVGVKSIMGVEGGIALQFLKSYLDLSDTKLIARVNTDWMLQMFCGVNFGLSMKIKDKDYVGCWRRKLAASLDIKEIQGLLMGEWKDDLEDKQASLMDATCYESHVRYPTDVKLLWESCEWVFESIFSICSELRIRRPRSRYSEKKLQYSKYSKRRKKGYKMTKKLRKQLIYLLNKGLEQLIEVVSKGDGIKREAKFYARLGVIGRVAQQQKELYETGGTAGADRVVSLAKPYLRPIVRGKETRRVEFGMKAHIIAVGGVCLIEYLSFNAFNECKRFKSAIRLHQKCIGTVSMAGADAIYATRENRKWCKENGITNSFVPVGRRPKEQRKKSDIKVAKKALNKERSTVLEGAFGNHKLHYGLGKIRAKTEKTEILWIAFGVWTASAMKIVKIREQKASPPKTNACVAA